jgi:hypothetical protein
MRSAKRIFVASLIVWQAGLLTLLTIAVSEHRIIRAMACMSWGISLLWIGGCGTLSILARDSVRKIVKSLPFAAPLTFFLFATLLALIEEAIATLMTNLAPLFGVGLGEAYVTASANYWDVIAFHSVAAFLPQFAAWAWLMSRYRFSPFAVFLLFGLTGAIDEAIFAGLQPLALPQWILIYGLMVYLPAYAYPDNPGHRPVRWWHYPFVLIIPILAAVPVVVSIMTIIAPGHPGLHFPPIVSD